MAAHQAVKFFRGQDEGGVLHAQGLANVALEVLLKGEAADGFDQPAGPVQAVAVLPALAGLEHERHEGCDADGGFAAVFFILDHFSAPGVVAEARGVGQEVLERDGRAHRAEIRLTAFVEALQNF